MPHQRSTVDEFELLITTVAVDGFKDQRCEEDKIYTRITFLQDLIDMSPSIDDKYELIAVLEHQGKDAEHGL